MTNLGGLRDVLAAGNFQAAGLGQRGVGRGDRPVGPRARHHGLLGRCFRCQRLPPARGVEGAETPADEAGAEAADVQVHGIEDVPRHITRKLPIDVKAQVVPEALW